LAIFQSFSVSTASREYVIQCSADSALVVYMSSPCIAAALATWSDLGHHEAVDPSVQTPKAVSGLKTSLDVASIQRLFVVVPSSFFLS
jgi:hypothetical protein